MFYDLVTYGTHKSVACLGISEIFYYKFSKLVSAFFL